MASLHDPSENFPGGEDVEWKRAKDFLEGVGDHGKKVIKVLSESVNPG